MKQLIAFLLIFYLYSCNLVSNKGQVEINLNKNRQLISDLDTVKIWCPYGYYCIDWQVFIDDKNNIQWGSKGMTEGNEFWGSYNLMNNYMYTSILNADSLNKTLLKISPEKAKLIWKKKHFSEIDSITTTGYMFLIFTKNKELFNNKTSLAKLSFDVLKK